MDQMWEKVFRKLSEVTGSVMVLGGVDTGKTTFMRELGIYLFSEGRQVGLVDADLGQSTVGPPAAIGAAFLVRSPEGTIEPDQLYFVGATSPRPRIMDSLMGSYKLVRYAEQQGARIVLVDTTGYIQGQLAMELKLHKVNIIEPVAIVAIQQGEELEPLLQTVESRTAVYRLQPHPEVRVRDQLERRAYRNERFRAYFEGAQRYEVKPSSLRWQVAEPSGDLLGGRARLLVGLLDEAGWCLGLGLMRQIYETGMLEVISPVPPERAATVRAGMLRFDQDLQEMDTA